jgi:hypothetical protein
MLSLALRYSLIAICSSLPHSLQAGEAATQGPMKTFAATGIAQFIEDAPEDLDPAVKVPALLKGLEKGDQRERALERLRSIGEDASDAIPQLLRMCDDSDLKIRFLAAQAVMSIDPFDYPKAMSTFFVTGGTLATAPNNSTIGNKASVTTTSNDPNPADNMATVTTTVLQPTG